ncbi:MAG TPA: DUF4845 domain-containing protein [Candidatus Saccharimonadia bacterium]|nr:DUF4845 domain-containing protein [Candidatus Saccharimonadia bacterium]
MHRVKNQAGLTAMGLILILIPVGLGVYIFMRAAPVYIEALSVGDVVNSLKKELDLREKSPEEIRTMIKKRLDVNNINRVDIKDDVKIQKTVNDVTVTIDYEARVPLFWNIALVFSFNKRAVVR